MDFRLNQEHNINVPTVQIIDIILKENKSFLLDPILNSNNWKMS